MSRQRISSFLTKLSTRLRDSDRWPQLLLLGLIAGVSSALIIIAFRSLVDYSLLMTNNADTHFAEYSREATALIPLVGAIIIGIVFHFIPRDAQRVSVGYVLDTLAHKGAVFRWSNTFVQLFGGAAAIATGQSVGREGPAVHLGAATSAGIGRWLMLSSPQLRLLAGCGVAAAIGASFNTPIAGVIFAMEVILMEYTAAGLLPIIVAATSATAISRFFYGDDPAFLVPALDSMSLMDAPWLLLGAVLAGIVSAAFIKIYKAAAAQRHRPVILRFTFIGVVTAIVVYFYPSVTGVGYDIVQQNLDGFLPIALLIALLFGKLLLTPIATGLGMPGGLIAATLFIGACLGGIVDEISLLHSGEAATTSSYVIIFMGTVMSAVLNAPLSALTAVLELTYAPDVLMPTMGAIIVANIVCREVLKQPGIFERPAIERTPWRQWAQATPCSRLMTRRVISVRQKKAHQEILDVSQHPKWVVITVSGEPIHVLPTEQYIELQARSDAFEAFEQLPSQNIASAVITDSAWGMLKRMESQNTEIAVIRRLHGKQRGEVLGVVTKHVIEERFKDSP